jgi:hypothetical protein
VTESELVEVETWASALEQDQHVVSTEMNCGVHRLDGAADDEWEFPLHVFSSSR